MQEQVAGGRGGLNRDEKEEQQQQATDTLLATTGAADCTDDVTDQGRFGPHEEGKRGGESADGVGQGGNEWVGVAGGAGKAGEEGNATVLQKYIDGRGGEVGEGARGTEQIK